MVSGNLAYKKAEPPQQEIVIQKSPVKWCSVSLSDVVDRGKRLEASVFDVEAKRARALVENGKYPAVMIGGEDGLASSYVCGRFKRIWLKKSEYPIFQPSSIVDTYPSPDGYLSVKTNTDLNKLRVHKGQVLMTCSGTIGKVSYVSKTLDNQIFSHDLLRISCKNDFDVGYIYTYFKSKIGEKILLTNSYGAVITHIEPEHLATVPIPNAPYLLKKQIHELVVKSYALRDESNMLIDEATQLLIDELHFPEISELEVADYKKGAPVETYSVKLSEISGRVDASYHVPIVDAIVEHMKKYAAEVTTLGDERISKDVILAGIFKRTYVEEGYGYPFLGGKEITQLFPQTEKFLSKPIHKVRYEKELKVEENMVLVTDRGTIGISAMVPKHWDGYAVSQNVLKVVPANNDISGYIYIFLNSEVGNILIRRQTYGSVVDMIDNNSLKQVEFPLLKNREIQKKINDLALKANEKRYEAYQLEQQALSIMNDKVLQA